MDFKALIPTLISSLISVIPALVDANRLRFGRLGRIQRLEKEISSAKNSGIDEARINQLREQMKAVIDDEKMTTGHNPNTILAYVLLALGTVGTGFGSGVVVWSYMNRQNIGIILAAWLIFVTGLIALLIYWWVSKHTDWLEDGPVGDTGQPEGDSSTEDEDSAGAATPDDRG